MEILEVACATTFHLVNLFDGNNTITFHTESMKPEESEILAAALEAVGWSGPYEPL